MELLLYLLKVSACMALLFAFYLLFLRKLTFFKTNRFYLLASLLLSFVIPTLQFTIERIIEPVQKASYAVLFEEESEGYGHQTSNMKLKLEPVAVAQNFSWYSLLPYLYAIVVVGLLSITAWRLYQLFKHTRVRSEKINGLKLVPKNVGFTNCSFFNYVFIDQASLTEAEFKVLLRHEEVHAKQYHSIDKIVMLVAKAVLWFNPIIYLYDKFLEETHEYEADEATSTNFGTEPYANLLLKLAVSKNSSPLIHNFVKSPIKERIKMLFHAKSENKRKLTYLLALPIGLGLVWGFTIDVVYASAQNMQQFIAQQNQLNAEGKALEKRPKDYLTPKIIAMSGAFLESNGEVNHLYEAKIKLFNGVLMAKEVESNLKTQVLIGYNATFKQKDSALVNGKIIVFDLKRGTFVINNELNKKSEDSLKRNRPRLISSASIKVDVRNQISYIKQGKMEVFDMVLAAEDITYDELAGTITAKTATLTAKDGEVIKAESIICDLKKGTYISDIPKEKAEISNPTVWKDFKIKFQSLAQDSTIKTDDGFILYGNVRIKLDDIVLTGKKIETSTNEGKLTIYKGAKFEFEGRPIEANLIEYNIMTKNGPIKNIYLSNDKNFLPQQ